MFASSAHSLGKYIAESNPSASRSRQHPPTEGTSAYLLRMSAEVTGAEASLRAASRASWRRAWIVASTSDAEALGEAIGQPSGPARAHPVTNASYPLSVSASCWGHIWTKTLGVNYCRVSAERRAHRCRLLGRDEGRVQHTIQDDTSDPLE